MRPTDLTLLLSQTAKRMLMGVEDARREGTITQNEADRLSVRCVELLDCLPPERGKTTAFYVLDAEACSYGWFDLWGVGAHYRDPRISEQYLAEYLRGAHFRPESPTERAGVFEQSLERLAFVSVGPRTRYQFEFDDPIELKTGARKPSLEEQEPKRREQGESAGVPHSPSVDNDEKRRLRRRTAELRGEFATDLARLHELGKTS
jgi:hypothetical protein